MFGAERQLGPKLCALGYCGEALEVDKIGVAFRSGGR
jgi:hypothetical protein